MLTHVATRAHAQTAGDPQFERGLQALEAGDAATAADAFTRSLAQAETSQGWFNLGIAQTQLGDPQAAWLAFDAYLASADPSTTERERIRVAEAEVQRLRSANATLVLAVQPPPEEIWVDQRPLWVKDNWLLLQPGRHVLELRRAGYAPLRQVLDLPVGRFRLRATLSPPTAPEPASPPLARSAPSGPRSALPQRGVGTPQPPLGAPEPPQASGASKGCLLGKVCLEGNIVLGVPNAIGIGLGAQLDPRVGVQVSAQVLPSIEIDGTSVSTQLWTVSGRYYPLSNGLFASLGLGLQRIFADRDHPLATAKAELNLPVLALGAGYTGRSGLTLGIDLAVLIELDRSRLKVETTNAPDQAELQAQLERETNEAIQNIRRILPVAFQLNLLRIGYTF